MQGFGVFVYVGGGPVVFWYLTQTGSRCLYPLNTSLSMGERWRKAELRIRKEWKEEEGMGKGRRGENEWRERDE